MSRGFRLLEHTSDILLEIRAESINSLFETAAEGLASQLYTKQPLLKEERRISLQENDTSRLLVLFLNEIIFLALSEYWGAGSVSVKIYSDRLDAVLKGSVIKSGLKREIKAATYHNLTLEKVKNEYKARLCFDL